MPGHTSVSKLSANLERRKENSRIFFKALPWRFFGACDVPKPGFMWNNLRWMDGTNRRMVVVVVVVVVVVAVFVVMVFLFLFCCCCSCCGVFVAVAVVVFVVVAIVLLVHMGSKASQHPFLKIRRHDHSKLLRIWAAEWLSIGVACY